MQGMSPTGSNHCATLSETPTAKAARLRVGTRYGLTQASAASGSIFWQHRVPLESVRPTLRVVRRNGWRTGGIH
jgi:hypothetical protein